MFSYSECVEILKGISHTVQHEITPMVDALLGRYASLDGRTYVSPFLSPGVPQVKVEPCLDIFASLKAIRDDIVSIRQSVEAISARIADKAKQNPLDGSQCDLLHFFLPERAAVVKVNPADVVSVQTEMRALFSRWYVETARRAAAVAAYEEKKRRRRSRGFDEMSVDELENYADMKEIDEAEGNLRRIKDSIQHCQEHGDQGNLGALIAQKNSLDDEIVRLHEELAARRRDLHTVCEPNPYFAAVDAALNAHIGQEIAKLIPGLEVNVGAQRAYTQQLRDKVTRLRDEVQRLRFTNKGGSNDKAIEQKEKKLKEQKQTLAEQQEELKQMQSDKAYADQKIALLQTPVFEKEVKEATIRAAQEERPGDYTSLWSVAQAIVASTDDRDTQLRLLKVLFSDPRAQRLFERLRAEAFLKHVPALIEAVFRELRNSFVNEDRVQAPCRSLFRYCCTGDNGDINYYTIFALSPDFRAFMAIESVTGIDRLCELREFYIKALMLLNICLDPVTMGRFGLQIRPLYADGGTGFAYTLKKILEHKPGGSPGLLEAIVGRGRNISQNPLDNTHDEMVLSVEEAKALAAASQSPLVVLKRELIDAASINADAVFEYAVGNAKGYARISPNLSSQNTVNLLKASLQLALGDVRKVIKGEILEGHGLIHPPGGFGRERDSVRHAHIACRVALMIDVAWRDVIMKKNTGRRNELLAVIAYRHNNSGASCLNDLYEALMEYFRDHDDDLVIPADADGAVTEAQRVFAEPRPGDEEEGGDSDGDAGGGRVRARDEGARAFGAAAAGAHVELAAV